MKKPTVPPAESNRSAFRRLRRSGFVASVLAVFAVCTWCAPRQAAAEVICVEDILPPGMAVTATGTATTCAGACRAREIRPVCGPIMKICAGQPIPPGYVLDSITTMPACQCLGSEDDAYVIRYVGTGAHTGDPLGDATGDSTGDRIRERRESPYGNPPFGNVLCATGSAGLQPYGSSSSLSGYGVSPPAPSSYGGTIPNDPRLLSGSPAPYPPSPQWDYQQDEPFRMGQ